MEELLYFHLKFGLKGWKNSSEKISFTKELVQKQSSSSFSSHHQKMVSHIDRILSIDYSVEGTPVLFLIVLASLRSALAAAQYNTPCKFRPLSFVGDGQNCVVR
jgi:hypothetical protein